MSRRFAITLAVLVCSLGAMAPSATAQSPASLAPTTAEAQQATTACGPGGAGDQLVPDSGPWFNFTAASVFAALRCFAAGERRAIKGRSKGG